MNIINENELINILSTSKKVLLIEPNYKRKYIPLGLAKISSFIKSKNGKIDYNRDYIGKEKYDLICITSLFTYDSDKVLDILNKINRDIFCNTPVIIGGIFASLMSKSFSYLSDRFYLYKGYSKILDSYTPDYDIDYGIDEKWKDFSFLFTTRGCENKCAYCAVHRIENEKWINPSWKNLILDNKKYVMISDNNLSSFPEHLVNVIEYVFKKNKKILFDNGFDCKLITNDMAKELSKLKFVRCGMRLAFDRIEEDGIFQKAVKLLIDNGISKSSIMAYCLFNFKDTFQEANYRMRECVKLGIRPYPQQYTPLNKLNRKNTFVGKHWTPNLLRTFRFFWLMAGYYNKMTFEEFIDSDKSKNYKLNEEDRKYLSI